MNHFLSLFALIFSVSAPAAELSQSKASPSEDSAGFENFYQRVMQIRQDSSRENESLVFHPVPSGPRVRLMGEWDPQNWGISDSRNGDLVFLIGHLEASPTRQEMKKFHGMIKWAIDSGFRAVMDPAALNEELRQTVRSDRTSVVIWSSHGSADGRVWDAKERAVPADAFADRAGDLLKMYVLSNCSGENTVKHYRFKPGSRHVYWEGKTTSQALFSYLYSTLFDDGLRDLGFSL
ncbi:MAG: hypothetical protein NDJ89_05595 [Oligoflexia bacterium]|nr:hypothetical protein [Oligoflexia bacterium]